MIKIKSLFLSTFRHSEKLRFPYKVNERKETGSRCEGRSAHQSTARGKDSSEARDTEWRFLAPWERVPISVRNHVTTLTSSSQCEFFFMMKGRVVMNCWYRKWTKKQKGSNGSVMHISTNSTSQLWKGLLCTMTVTEVSERQGHCEGLLNSLPVESFWKDVCSTKGWAVLHRFHTIVRLGWHPRW